MSTELAELLEEVRRIDVLAKRLVTDVMAGGYTSAFRGGGLEFDSVREYVPGDARRLIDWNVTARVGRPFVKTFVDERELTVLFLLDLSPSMEGGYAAWSARQVAARICACLALTAVRNNDKVGLITFDDGMRHYVKPAKGSGHALRIVRDCLALPARSGGTNLTPALEFAAKVVRRHAVVFVVSDFLTDGWEDAMAICGRRHDVVGVHIEAPELDPPARGVVRLHDPESGEKYAVDWRRAGPAYREATAAHRTSLHERLRRAQVDRMDVPLPLVRTPDAIAQPILKFFRMRESRSAKR